MDNTYDTHSSFSLLQQNLTVKGTEALDLTLPFDEKLTLQRNLNYLTRSLDVSTAHYWLAFKCPPES